MYKIIEIRNNTDIDYAHPSFGTFDVLVRSLKTLDDKWVSIPHELYFAYLSNIDNQLDGYISKRNFESYESAIEDLESIGYNLSESLLGYVKEFVPVSFFDIMPSYDPDFFKL